MNAVVTSPPRPLKAILAPGFTARRLSELQDLAAQDGFTIVNHRLQRTPPEAFVQKVTPLERLLLERVSSLLKVPIWDIWMETHWVPNIEMDPSFGANRVDHVVFKRSPVRGLTAENREDTWRPVVEALGGHNGWPIEDEQQSGIVTLSWGKRLALPSVAEYDWDLPVTYRSIPFGVTERNEVMSLGALESNIIFGGTPGSGKSGGLTCWLAGAARLENLAIIGLDPKRVEQAMWSPRFSRIAKDPEQALDVLERLDKQMDARYVWLEKRKLKKLKEEHFSPEMPFIALVIDELADLVASGMTKEEKIADGMRIQLIRRLIALGRAAGITVIGATQKPQSDVIPTAIRDLVQQRVAYATTNSHMTDTILGQGMSSNGGVSQEIAPDQKGVCYVVNESSRTPLKVRTYWIPDEDVEGIAERTAHLRVQLDWLDPTKDLGAEDDDDLLPALDVAPTIPIATPDPAPASYKASSEAISKLKELFPPTDE